ncbi:hypothetical protein OF377_00325 [Ureaplasma sp. ES3154-GEN]|uniref:hypothetical protein n=1 Tax=Ureaplasma sp. ES3154-GEN TaxID=2984844 RepID=UPI0021E96062|nr:hypothetical protein [Ureaplasma sp. ES3154-GEN]MCV3743333.1 hypothetical protein [Ureaplasma sp. ES3154-GEN]
MINNLNNALLLRTKTNAYLNIVFLNQKLNHAVATDKDFAQLVSQVIVMLEQLEQETTNRDTVNNSVEFNKALIAYHPNIISTPIQLNDVDDYEDLLSSLQHYVQNTYTLNIGEFVSQFTSVNFIYDKKESYGYEEIEQTKVETEPAVNKVASDQVVDLDDETISDQETTNQSKQSSMDEDVFKNQYLDQAAMMVWNQQVLDNKIYIYKTKPRIIPIIKYSIFALLLLLFLSAVISFATKTTIITNSDLYVEITRDDNKRGIFSLSQVNSIGVPVMLIAVGLITIFMGISVFKRNQNENSKYSFKFGFFGFFIVAFFIIAIVEIFNKGTISFKNGNIALEFNNIRNFSLNYLDKKLGYNPLNDGTIRFSDSVSVQAFYDHLFSVWMTSFVFKMIEFAMIFAILVCLIIALVFRPKYDHERNAELINQIRDDILNDRINPNQYVKRSQSMFSRLFDM